VSEQTRQEETEGEVAVIGAGGWGTALANLLGQKGIPVSTWVYEEDLCKTMHETRENPLYLPGISLASALHPDTSLQAVASAKRVLVMAVPSHVYRQVARQMIPFLSGRVIIVSATKGIENESLRTMGEIWREIMPVSVGWDYVALSGPSFAREVATHVPTAVTVASTNKEAAVEIQRLFATPYFRVYSSTDVIGVELGGALKNIIALAAGIIDGLGLGHNSRAALITRGLAEMSRLGTTMGANPLTFLGLSGVGDLVLTCTGALSRNRSVGIELGRGKRLDDILADMRMVAEGVKTTRSVYHLARRQGVDLPICEEMYRILYEGRSPREAVASLMQRDLKHEPDTFFPPNLGDSA
jgi:glycerol-3-phosphate dehydrogenase (NAD(P)+)